MSEDYIDLAPDDVIREGDEWKRIEIWHPVISVAEFSPFGDEAFVGRPSSEFKNIKFRRPRSTLIRDAAIELLRDAYILDDTTGGAYNDVYIDVNLHLAEALREAIGISVEELRNVSTNKESEK